MVNTSSHLISCHFPSWTPHLLCQKMFSHVITCHFPSLTSVFSWKSQDSFKFDDFFSHVIYQKKENTCPLGRCITPMSCAQNTIAKSIQKSNMSCAKKPGLNRPQSPVSSAPTIHLFRWFTHTPRCRGTFLEDAPLDTDRSDQNASELQVNKRNLKGDILDLRAMIIRNLRSYSRLLGQDVR